MDTQENSRSRRELAGRSRPVNSTTDALIEHPFHMIALLTWLNMASSIQTLNMTSLLMKCCRIASSAFASLPFSWCLARQWSYYCGFLRSFVGWLSFGLQK